MNHPAIKILPSLLAADVGRLAEEARRAEAAGADALHLDIMDGHFVPNLSFGPAVVSMARATVALPLNVHLMMDNPEKYAERFIQAGASTLLIHSEIAGDRRALLRRIRGWGARAGITLNPETPLAALEGLLAEADEVLCMTVHPGYGGQSFLADVLPKISAVRAAVQSSGLSIDISVDGGIDLETAAAAAAAGANLLIAGTSLYGQPAMASAILSMRKACEAARQTSHS